MVTCSLAGELNYQVYQVYHCPKHVAWIQYFKALLLFEVRSGTRRAGPEVLDPGGSSLGSPQPSLLAGIPAADGRWTHAGGGSDRRGPGEAGVLRWGAGDGPVRGPGSAHSR